MTAATPHASCASSGRPTPRAAMTATKPLAASSSPPASASVMPTLFQRLLPPSFRDPTARRSTPRARATQYGNDTDPARYERSTARTAGGPTRVILPVLQMCHIDRRLAGGRRIIRGVGGPSGYAGIVL